MGGRIEVQALSGAAVDLRTPSPTRISLLPGAIAGVETSYYIQPGGTDYSPARHQSRAQVFCFIRGAGKVQMESMDFDFSEIAACCAPSGGPVVIQATGTPVEYFEILIELQPPEIAQLDAKTPYGALYSQCEPYAEAIKSPKTVSRTIVPAGTIPRFCMGSVQTEGPDTVGAHSHPMLEQLFFGLPGNSCVVMADQAEAALEDRALLHIPLGSWHGARVEEGRRLHYVWMDFFKQEGDLAYIQAQHQPIRTP
ncbi:MAG TPA: cupin domain-containing protein [Candidatus Methylomirabilis sp.]|nr:cupin domain-containing protein [Candidatus Methylomirabilis sp.]